MRGVAALASALLAQLTRHRLFDPLRGQELKALVLKGSVWTLAGFGSQKLLQLGSNLILTRLLFPEAFGIMALVTTFMVALNNFSDVGIQPAIVQHERGEDEAFLNTAWTIQVIRGFVLWVIFCLIAWPVSQFYGQPVLFPLLCVVGSTAAIMGFRSTAVATANRKLRLGRLTLLQLGSQLVAIISMVILAWIYNSVWALAIGGVIGVLVDTVLGHLFLPSHRHALRMERRAFDAIVRFGRWIFLSTLVTFIGGKGITAIQGGLVSIETLGFLAISSQFAWMFGDLASRFLSTVGFPALSRIAREQPERFREVFDSIRIRLLLATLPAFMALSLISAALIDFLYDDRYAAAGPYLAIMAISGALVIIPMAYQSAFMAQGNSRMHFILITFSTILRISGLLAGFHLAGIEGMLLGIGAGSLAYYAIVAYAAHKAGWLSLRVDVPAIAFILAGAWVSLGRINLGWF